MNQPVFKGQIPYGYRIGLFGEIQEDEQEQVVLQFIKESVKEGLKAEQIAGELDRKKIPSKKGGGWHPRVIRKIISKYLVLFGLTCYILL